jgi:2-polyprenyl-6-methoxyphenol hydroxylase-like FAD-dependent oxidoreductase
MHRAPPQEEHMFFAHDSDVLVVGGGPVGLATALMLARRGVSVEVIEEEASTQRHNYAVQLHPATLRLLDDAGIAAELLAAGIRLDRMELFDGHEQRAEIRLDQGGGEFPFLLVLSRNVLEATLDRHLRLAKVPVAWFHRLADLAFGAERHEARIEKLGSDSGGYSVSANMLVVEKHLFRRPRYVIGADGFHSAVRRRAGIEMSSLGPPQSFAACEFTTDVDLGRAVRVVFAGDTTSVLWPLPGGSCRWVLSLARELPADTPLVHVGQRSYPRAPRQVIEGLLKERAPWFTGAIKEVRWAAQVRFEPGLCDRFGEGRTWLVGDAAHVTGPVGIQSLNGGVQEGHSLASRLSRVIHGESAELLDAYAEERRRAWSRMMGLGGGLLAGAHTDAWVAAHRERLLSVLPAVGDELAPLAEQIGLTFAP